MSPTSGATPTRTSTDATLKPSDPSGHAIAFPDGATSENDSLTSASLPAGIVTGNTNVAVAPGVGFGEYGDQYVRLALVENEQRIRQAARNIKKLLSGAPSLGNVVPLTSAK